MPSTSTENISSGNDPKITNDEINGLFEGLPLNITPQVWTVIKNHLVQGEKLVKYFQEEFTSTSAVCIYHKTATSM